MRDSYDEEIVCVYVWRMKVKEMLIKGCVERYRDDNDSVYIETEVNRESSKNGMHTKQYRAIIITVIVWRRNCQGHRRICHPG